MNIADKKVAYEIIRRVSGQNNILTIPRIYIDITGNIKSALFLSQCIYWADKMGRAFYKTYDEWKSETGLSRWDVDNARKECKGIVTASLKKANGAPTLHYTVEWDKLYEALEKLSNGGSLANGFAGNSQMDLSESSKSLTETTTEITTDINKSFASEDKKFRKPRTVEEHKQMTVDSMARGYERRAKEILGDDDLDKINQYPEDVRPIISAVCELFNLKCPGIKSSHAGDWINEGRELLDACGEFGCWALLNEIAKDFKQHMRVKGGTVPFPVSGPRSLVNVARAKAGELRGKKSSSQETYKGYTIPRGASRVYIDGKEFIPGVGEVKS